jgi:dipeptidyl aminopeptidase/acylaminoacyl peptidase
MHRLFRSIWPEPASYDAVPVVSSRRSTLHCTHASALLVSLLVFALPGTAQTVKMPSSAAPGRTGLIVELPGRTIDLQAHLMEFPFGSWSAVFGAGQLLYLRTTPQGQFLHAHSLPSGAGDPPLDPEAGRLVNAIDWSGRWLGERKHDPQSGDIIVVADERNDEITNLYRLSLSDGSLTRLTDVHQILAFDFAPDGRRLAYVGRHGAEEPRRSCLYMLHLPEHEQREIVCDNGGEFRMTASELFWHPSGKSIIVKVLREDDRLQSNLAYVDLTRPAPAMEILLPSGGKRVFWFAFGLDVPHWLDERQFYYTSEESGTRRNLYSYDLRTRSARAVTRFEEAPLMTAPIEISGRSYYLFNFAREHETELRIIDPVNGDEIGRRSFEEEIATWDIGHDGTGRVLLRRQSIASPFRVDELRISLENGRAVWRLDPFIRMPAHLASSLEHCVIERVEYPTFGMDPASGSPRTIAAFLLTPKRPRANPAERLALIKAYYGGGNRYETQAQIFCEAGFAVLHPAVATRDGDLGGDEIVDLFHAARFLEQRLGLQAHQIGLYGASHGGYATMRALTFPTHTNGRNDWYPFGFGISHAGMSNLLEDHTNIPDWLRQMAGDPASDGHKLADRSPLTHVARLQAPLLLTHGSNDNRISITGSRRFYEAARDLGKPVAFEEFGGQGHAIRGVEEQARWYRVQLEFLQEVIRQNHLRD